MTVLLAIDPGIAGRCGAACFVDGRLNQALIIKPYVRTFQDDYARAAAMGRAVAEWVLTFGRAPDRLVIEWPRIYRAGKTKADPNDMLLLTAIGGAIAGALFRDLPNLEISNVAPNAWKGDLPETQTQARVIARLDEDERQVLAEAFERTAPSARHNVSDAVGIGLDALKRFKI